MCFIIIMNVLYRKETPLPPYVQLRDHLLKMQSMSIKEWWKPTFIPIMGIKSKYEQKT